MVTAMKNDNVFMSSIVQEGIKTSWQTVAEHLVKNTVLRDVEGYSRTGSSSFFFRL